MPVNCTKHNIHWSMLLVLGEGLGKAEVLTVSLDEDAEAVDTKEIEDEEADEGTRLDEDDDDSGSSVLREVEGAVCLLVDADGLGAPWDVDGAAAFVVEGVAGSGLD